MQHYCLFSEKIALFYGFVPSPPFPNTGKEKLSVASIAPVNVNYLVNVHRCGYVCGSKTLSSANTVAVERHVWDM